MKPKVQACLSQLIVSCQAYEDTPLYGAETMKKMVQSAMLGGAQAVRCCWPQDIRAARSLSEKLIIIGINKVMPKGEKKLDDVFITPTFEKRGRLWKRARISWRSTPGSLPNGEKRSCWHCSMRSTRLIRIWL